MELDDLKAVWHKEVNMTAHIVNFEKIQQDVEKLDRCSNRTWLREGIGAIVCIVGLIGFVWGYLPDPSLLTQFSAIALMATLGYAAKRFYDSQQNKTVDDWTVLAKVNRQIEKREKEVKMLSNLAVWHILPIAMSVLLFTYSVHVDKSGESMPTLKLVFWWTVGGVYLVFMHYLNKRVLNNKFQPALDKLKEIKKALEQDKV